MSMSEYSLSDYALASGNGGLFGGNNGFLEAILAFAIFGGGFGGFGWGNRGGNCGGGCATTEDLASGFNFSSLQGKTNDILAAVNNNNQVLGNAICQLGYQGAQHTYELGSKIDSCCCATQRAVDSAKFDMANYAAATNVAIMEGTQKILDKMCADQTAALQARVNQLENQQAIAAATAGIPRINTDAWGVRMYPTCVPCGCNPCCTASM